jgi:hypothetical protein
MVFWELVCIFQALRFLGIRTQVSMDMRREVHNPWFLGTREIPVEEFHLETSLSDIP